MIKKHFIKDLSRLGGICIFVFFACSRNIDQNSETESFIVVNPMILDTSYTSKYVTEIHSLQNVELRARAKGYIEKIFVDEGSYVKAGQLLFSISSQQYQEELLKAKALLKTAIAEEKAQEINVRSMQSLVAKNVVAKSELELAQSKLEAAKASVEEAKANESSAAINLSYTAIKAPFDGIINRIPNKEGSLVDEGTLLTSISNNKEVFAYFSITENEYLDFKTSNRSFHKNEVSLVLNNGTPYPHKGIIETIEGEFDKSTGTIALRARFPNPDEILRHRSSGKILFNMELKSAMMIPQKATYEVQDKIFVFTVDANNIAHLKPINVKQHLSHIYILESGLQAGDKVIYEGVQHVKEGDTITVKQMNMKELISKEINSI